MIFILNHYFENNIENKIIENSYIENKKYQIVGKIRILFEKNVWHGACNEQGVYQCQKKI